MALLARGVAPLLVELVGGLPVVIVEGGRGVGKTTLCRMVATANGWPDVLDLSDQGVVAQLRLDPHRFLSALPTPAILDEAQLVPELPLWVKRVVDERGGRPSQFVLTGSARLGREQLGGSDPLAGRAVRVHVWPFTPQEVAASQPLDLSTLFEQGWVEGGQTVAGVELAEWRWGGLPGMAGVLVPPNATRWDLSMSSYLEATIPLGATSTRVDHSRMARAFRYLAGVPGRPLNLATVASELGMKADTVRGYLEQLESAFLLFRVEAHRPLEHRVVTAHPRIFAGDVGLAAWTLRQGDAEPEPLQLGMLLENLVAISLSAAASWSSERIAVRHWRDERAKREVDLLLVHRDGGLVPIEVKASGSVHPDDTRGLLAFQDAHGDRHRAGYLVYRGSRVVDLTPPGRPDGSIMAVPSGLLIGA